MRILLASLLLLIAALAAPACGPSFQDICALRCDCEGCSDRDYDECLRDLDDDAYEADREGCLDLHDDYLACQDATARCDRDDFKHDCKPERDRLKRCVD